MFFSHYTILPISAEEDGPPTIYDVLNEIDENSKSIKEIYKTIVDNFLSCFNPEDVILKPIEGKIAFFEEDEMLILEFCESMMMIDDKLPTDEEKDSKWVKMVKMAENAIEKIME